MPPRSQSRPSTRAARQHEAPDAETVLGIPGVSEDAPRPAYVRIRAKQNVSVGGVFVEVGQEDDVPDVPELHDCVNAGLVEIIDKED